MNKFELNKRAKILILCYHFVKNAIALNTSNYFSFKFNPKICTDANFDKFFR